MERAYRQKIIDEYLNATGRNEFVPDDFLLWLAPQSDHRAWKIFYSKTDAEAAHEHRLSLARQFVSGLKIRVVVTAIETQRFDHLRVKVEEPTTFRVPAFVSPVARRTEGGGYVSLDHTDAATMRETYRQASQGLASWVERWGDVAKMAGADICPVEQVVGALAVAGAPGAAEA